MITIITIHDSKENNFNNNGLEVLNECTSCFVTQELNKNYSLSLDYPKDEQNKYLSIKGLNIIKAGGQLFRIPLQENIQDNGISVRVTANHIFYDLNNDYTEDSRAENKSVTDALKIAIAVNSKFSVTECDDLGLNTAYFVSENPTASIYNKILTRWGGELYRDNYNVAIKQRLGATTGGLISYGKDILGFTQRLDWTGLATRIKPVGKDGCTIDLVNSGSKYLVSPRVNNYPFVITKEIKFDNIEDATELKNAGLALWGIIDLPSCNYSVKFADLSKTKEYEKFKDLLTLKLGDIVTIKHKIFNCNITARVIKIRKNILTDSIEDLELGQFKENQSTKFTKMDGKIQFNETNIVETKTDLNNTKVKFKEDMDGLTIEVGKKVGETEVKSIIQQSPEAIKIGFNNISNIVDIREDGLRVSHGGTDYTHMGATGFKRHVGSEDKDYHYLTAVGTFTSLNSSYITVNLPEDFRGKNYEVIACISVLENLETTQNICQAYAWVFEKNACSFRMQAFLATAGSLGLLDAKIMISWTAIA